MTMIKAQVCDKLHYKMLRIYFNHKFNFTTFETTNVCKYHIVSEGSFDGDINTFVVLRNCIRVSYRALW